MRTLSDWLAALLAGRQIPIQLAARISLPSGDYAISDGYDDFDWNDLTYHGVGAAMQVELAATSTQTLPQPSALHLSAINPAILASIFDEAYKGAPAALVLIVRDPATRAPMAELSVASGYVDTATFDEGSQAVAEPDKSTVSTLTFSLAPDSSDLSRAGSRTGTDADQRAHRDPDDGFFKDVGLVASAQINWGRQGATSPGQIVTTGGAA